MPPLTFDESGWFLIRAVSDLEKTYRFAATGPYYVEVDGKPRISKRSAEFFLNWVNERIENLKLDDPQQRRETLRRHEAAREFWKAKVEAANAE